MIEYKIVSFYKFFDIKSPEILKNRIFKEFKKNSILGTLILSQEGVNGMLSGKEENLNNIVNFLLQDFNFKTGDFKYFNSLKKPFHRLRIKIKDEIISLGKPNSSNPNKNVGEYLQPREWNTLLEKEDVILIDTRNYYETSIGTFKNSIIPNMSSFKDFPKFVDSLSKYKNKNIAMFCTGGIRCEKASSYMIEKGFKNVFHLEGGIINYLGQVKEEISKWQGECFVFDNRVSVKHDLSEGSYKMCHACNQPLSLSDSKSHKFKEGVHCHKCFGKLNKKQIKRLSERQKQMDLAKKRGKVHLGV